MRLARLHSIRSPRSSRWHHWSRSHRPTCAGPPLSWPRGNSRRGRTPDFRVRGLEAHATTIPAEAAGGRIGSVTASRAVVRLGLRENLGQFVLLVAVSALVGGMVGQERTVL